MVILQIIIGMSSLESALVPSTPQELLAGNPKKFWK
jgi:hypothetical protein